MSFTAGRAMIINCVPAQRSALGVSKFCKTQKICHSNFFRLRENEFKVVLRLFTYSRGHQGMRTRKYEPDDNNGLVKIQENQKDKLDHDSKTIHYKTPTNVYEFFENEIPSVAMTALVPAEIGLVDRDHSYRTEIILCSLFQGQRQWRCGNLMLADIAPSGTSLSL